MVSTMLPSVHDHQGAPKSQFKFSATFYGEEEETEVILKGHKVVGTSYTGTLPCTGLTLWPVADLCANFIASRSDGFKGKRVLEVGCGLGLCGIIAAKAIGPSGSIILTDGDSEVVEIALQNIESNNVQNNATATTLFWNDEEKIQEILNTHNINHNYTNNTTSATNAVESDGRFDIIIASDCLYRNSANTKILFSLAAAMLKRNHTASNTNTMQSVDHSATTTTHSTDEPQPNPVTSTEISQPEVEDTDTDLLQPSGDGGGWYYPSAHDHSVESDAKYTIASSYKPVVQYDLETNILEQSNCSSSTTNNTPQKNEYSTDYNNTTSTTNTSSIKDSRQPVFILAFTRRLDGNEASIDVIFQAAKEVGFEYEIAYDSVIDMFGNITCERTMMWEHCIFIFTWKK